MLAERAATRPSRRLSGWLPVVYEGGWGPAQDPITKECKRKKPRACSIDPHPQFPISGGEDPDPRVRHRLGTPDP
jgi:hypothetical protein